MAGKYNKFSIYRGSEEREKKDRGREETRKEGRKAFLRVIPSQAAILSGYLDRSRARYIRRYRKPHLNGDKKRPR